MADFLIVDGYNILYAWNSLKRALTEDIGYARTKLVDILGNYQAVKDIKVIVIFDAHLVKGGLGSKEEVAGVEVIYTEEGETADMAIEKLVGQFTENDKVMVATSDWTQQRIVFGKGAIRLSARELEEEVIALVKEVQTQYGKLYDHDRKLHGRLNDKIRGVFEEIRRQK